MDITTYKGARLKEGAFKCVKSRLYKGEDYLNIKWFEKILTDKFPASTLKLLTIYIAYDDAGKAVGSGIVFPWNVTSTKDVRLLSVFVLPKHRKQKVGSSILNYMTKQSYPFKTKLVYNTSSAPGRAFYKKHKIAELGL